MESGTIDVSVNSDQNEYLIDETCIKAMAHKVLVHMGIPEFELSIRFVDNPTMHKLNFDYRQKPTTTDVLSFPQIEFSPPLVSHLEDGHCLSLEVLSPSLGDVAISLDQASLNAENIGQSLDREVGFLLVHGILHLCGHDHIELEEEKLMILEQNKLMTVLNQVTNKPLWSGCVGKR